MLNALQEVMQLPRFVLCSYLVIGIAYALLTRDDIDDDLFALTPDFMTDDDSTSYAAMTPFDQGIGSDADIFAENDVDCHADMADNLLLPAKRRRQVCKNEMTVGDDPMKAWQTLVNEVFLPNADVCPPFVFG